MSAVVGDAPVASVTVAVTVGESYEVKIGAGLLGHLGELCARPATHAVVVCDENVAPLYLERVRAGLEAADTRPTSVVLPAGEQTKTTAVLGELYERLYGLGVTRHDTVVALGGGVIGDLAGYAAATFLRGLRLVQAPTTLLAMVDAAVGGKVAVDFRAGKNYVGTFYQPWLVLADLDVLATLPSRELRSGAAEVAKYGLLAGGELGRLAARLAAAGLSAAAVEEELAAACVRYKLDVVAADEREESGARAVLNLGHTVGHAIEAATGFARYTHGEAVALGLHAALRLSREVAGLPEREERAGHELLDDLGLPGRLEGVSAADVCALTGRDKKAGAGGAGCVLLEAVGAPRVGASVPPALEREVVEWLATR